MAEQQRKRLVVGNWKMNGSLEANKTLLNGILANVTQLNSHVVVCPSFPYLAQAQSILNGTVVSWGAQDVSLHDKGAYTSEVSVAMLADFECQWAIVGHSERRSYHQETSQQVADKAAKLLAHGIVPIVCVGESLQEREQAQTLAVIEQQLAPILALGLNAASSLVIAYEPVWAIGTGLTASPEQAQEVHAFIRSLLLKAGAGHLSILYGGSVNSKNAASLFTMPDIDGALVGGASLVADDFLAIAQA